MNAKEKKKLRKAQEKAKAKAAGEAWDDLCKQEEKNKEES